MADRKPIPRRVVSAVLMANRHACCVCQKPRVQLHHIDEDPSNNNPENLAALCLDHHDMASMRVGLTKKLQAKEVRKYKESWERRCADDIQALSRDRLAFYSTSYKNPPRIRELFLSLSKAEREAAAAALMTQIRESEDEKAGDLGYSWQLTPRQNDSTMECLRAFALGELYPSHLPRVDGHELDPDYPADLSTEHGMAAFHGYDLYSRVQVMGIWNARPGIALEQLRGFEDPSDMEAYCGTLISFREKSESPGIPNHSQWKESPTCQVVFRREVADRRYKVTLNLKTMYIFSDTASMELADSKLCGIGVLSGASVEEVDGRKEVRIQIKPLLIGTGGLGQSDEHGLWLHNQADDSDDL